MPTKSSSGKSSPSKRTSSASAKSPKKPVSSHGSSASLKSLGSKSRSSVSPKKEPGSKSPKSPKSKGSPGAPLAPKGPKAVGKKIKKMPGSPSSASLKGGSRSLSLAPSEETKLENVPVPEVPPPQEVSPPIGGIQALNYTPGQTTEEVIARNQEAAAALAALIGKQREIDQQKLDEAVEKSGTISKLLIDREMDRGIEVSALQKQVITLQNDYASVKRENTVLKEVLADTEGSKVVLKLERLEDENKQLRVELSKWKEMSEYHRNAHLKAMEDVESLKKGQPIGPTATDWEKTQDNISRLAKENTEITLKMTEVAERLASTEIIMTNKQRALESYERMFQQKIDGSTERSGQVTHQDPYVSIEVSNKPQNPANISYFDTPRRQQSNSYQFSSFSGSPVQGVASPPFRGTASGWRVLVLPNGNVVYNNIISNRSQWEMPPEIAMAINQSSC
eukprot:Tbor_TRINITY_DN3851_c0_g1::TRINITY_DN3851_c0_g1_i1::g.5724::m.5724